MRLRYAATNASEVTAPAASARISAAMDCSVGSKAEVAARNWPTAAASDRAPVVVRKPRRSMNYPLWHLVLGVLHAQCVLGVDRRSKYFRRNSLQFPVDLLLIFVGYEISHIPMTPNITLQGMNTNDYDTTASISCLAQITRAASSRCPVSDRARSSHAESGGACGPG